MQSDFICGRKTSSKIILYVLGGLICLFSFLLVYKHWYFGALFAPVGIYLISEGSFQYHIKDNEIIKRSVFFNKRVFHIEDMKYYKYGSSTTTNAKAGKKELSVIYVLDKDSNEIFSFSCGAYGIQNNELLLAYLQSKGVIELKKKKKYKIK